MIPLLAIPYYNRPDLLDRCICSIDHEIDTLVLVDNSPECGLTFPGLSLAAHDVIRVMAKRKIVISHPNAGWAGSCNEVIKLFPCEPFWLLVNNDIQFATGDLAKMSKAAWQEVLPVTVPGKSVVQKTQCASALFGNHGASWWAMTAIGVQKVGLLDENFFPCYLDDCDFCYRAKLAGAKLITVEGCNSIHGDENVPGSCTINSSEELKRKNHRTHGRLFEYYKEKWGGMNDHEVFQHPFNNPNYPVQYWMYRPEFRKGQLW